MIKETGKIVAIEKRYGKRVAVIECISKSACSSCHNSNSCGVGVVAKTYSDKTHQFEVPYKEGMETDKSIELQISSRNLIKSALLAYLVPLLFFIGGALLTRQLGYLNEIIQISMAIASAAIGFAVTRRLSNKLFSEEPFNNILADKSVK